MTIPPPSPEPIAPIRALVLGLGTSGIAAARLLREEGAEVVAVDAAEGATQRAAADALRAAGAEVILGVRALPTGFFDLAVSSPGVPAESPWMNEARQRGLPVIPEFEFGAQRLTARRLAVTGSNGKSTVVKWLAEALAQAGQRAQPAGNYGLPVCELARQRPPLDWLVLELSSFQLEASVGFRADVSVLLNLVPNHLDRHPDFEAYAAAKGQLFAHNRAGDRRVVPCGDVQRWRAGASPAGEWITFGPEPEADYGFAAGAVWHHGESVADLRGTYFDNDVLGLNAAAVLAALSCCDVPAAAGVAAARHFQALPHRMEWVAERSGVRFVDDSKATTLAALAAGVRMCPGPVRLIAGGLVKEKELSWVKEVLAQKVRGVYLIGNAMQALAEAWSDALACRCCGTLEVAVKTAAAEAQSGETVLLSPGCSSFDQFSGYAQRGDTFRQLVNVLRES